MARNGTVCVQCRPNKSPLDREAGRLMAGATARIAPAHGHVTAMSLNQEVTDIGIVGNPDRCRGIEVGTGVTRGVAKLVILPAGHMNGVAVRLTAIGTRTMISVGPVITTTARGTRHIGAITRQRATVMGLLGVGEIARLRDATTLAVPPAGNQVVLPVAHAADLQVRHKGIVQLTTARIVVGLDIGTSSVGIRAIKVGIRGHNTGRLGKTIQAPVIKGPHRESELDLQVPGQGRKTSARQIHPTPRAVGPTKIRVTPREKA